jgi:hypothetical protein
MRHEANRLADAIRLNVNALDAVIMKVRHLHEIGKEAPKASARYLEYVRTIHEMSERAREVGGHGPLFDNKMQPVPYRDQMVGFSAEEMQALRWKGVADCLRMAPVVEPVRFLEAAE